MNETRIFLIIFLGSIISYSAVSQSNLELSVVIDSVTKKPVSFASIVIGSTKRGTTADIDGKFKVRRTKELQTITISSVGYETKKIEAALLNDTIYLIPSNKLMEEVVVKQNDISDPFALSIIRKAIANKKSNNPDANDYYQYESYSKMFVDTLPGSKAKKDEENTANSHFFFMIESVMQHLYKKPSLRNNKLLAQKVSGIKKPFIMGIFTQVQYFSFYPDEFQLIGVNYKNPVSNKYYKNYVFQFIDSLKGADGSNTYIISFRPKYNSLGIDLLKGQVHIHDNDFAIANVDASAFFFNQFSSLSFKQKYDQVNNTWFPAQLNTDIQFLPDERNKDNSGVVKISVRSYLKNIQLNEKIPSGYFDNYVTTVAPDVDDKDENFWKQNRTVPLNKKEEKTYVFVDSVVNAIPEAKRALNRLEWLGYLAQGYIPVKKINIDLRKIINFNGFEDVRLGLGLETNHNLWKQFKVGGYWGYGFKDKAPKYGGFAEWIPNIKRDLSIGVSYKKDIALYGLSGFKMRVIPVSGYQYWLTNKADNIEATELYANFWLFKRFKTKLFTSFQNRAFNEAYQFVYPDKLNEAVNRMQLVEGGIHIQSYFRQGLFKFENFKFDRASVNDFLDLDIRIGKSINEIGAIDYQKIEAKYIKRILMGRGASLLTTIAAGYINGNTPYSLLYSNMGTNRRNFDVAVPGTFQTMNLFEFTNDRYVGLFTDFQTGFIIQKRKSFGVQLLFSNNIGIGNISTTNMALHKNISVKPMDNIYAETGFGFKLKTKSQNIGLMAFYRYGNYKKENSGDNFSFRLILY